MLEINCARDSPLIFNFAKTVTRLVRFIHDGHQRIELRQVFLGFRISAMLLRKTGVASAGTMTGLLCALVGATKRTSLNTSAMLCIACVWCASVVY